MTHIINLHIISIINKNYYLFARGDRMIYIYNKIGIQTVFPEKCFLKLKENNINIYIIYENPTDNGAFMSDYDKCTLLRL